MKGKFRQGLKFGIDPVGIGGGVARTAAASPWGTRTPAPQRLQAIFLPAISGFVANFRPHAGQENRRVGVGAGSAAAPAVSIGAGTVIVLPHPPQAICRPIWDHSTSFACPQARQVHGNVIRDPTSGGCEGRAGNPAVDDPR